MEIRKTILEYENKVYAFSQANFQECVRLDCKVQPQVKGIVCKMRANICNRRWAHLAKNVAKKLGNTSDLTIGVFLQKTVGRFFTDIRPSGHAHPNPAKVGKSGKYSQGAERMDRNANLFFYVGDRNCPTSALAMTNE